MGCGGVAPASVSQPVRVPVSHSLPGRGTGGFLAGASPPAVPTAVPAATAAPGLVGGCPGQSGGEPWPSPRSVLAAGPSAMGPGGTRPGEPLTSRDMPRGAPWSGPWLRPLSKVTRPGVSKHWPLATGGLARASTSSPRSGRLRSRPPHLFHPL